MRQFAISFWLWLPAVLRATLFALMAMGGAYLAATNDIKSEQIAAWGKHEWTRVSIGIGIAGITPIIAFLDQSLTFIRSKFGDTAFLTKDQR